jgi:hypothetical protein
MKKEKAVIPGAPRLGSYCSKTNKYSVKLTYHNNKVKHSS